MKYQLILFSLILLIPFSIYCMEDPKDNSKKRKFEEDQLVTLDEQKTAEQFKDDIHFKKIDEMMKPVLDSLDINQEFNTQDLALKLIEAVQQMLLYIKSIGPDCLSQDKWIALIKKIDDFKINTEALVMLKISKNG